jgi:HSP20 family molecular chaperone IbpA
MDGEDGAVRRPSVPEVFRRLLERLDRFAPLPPGTGVVPRLGPGAVSLDLQGRQIEPATDVIEGVDAIFVTIDLPGVRRRDIDLRATEGTLVVSANSPTRTYYREIPLPAPVRTDVIRVTYKNGVLDVSLERKDRTWHITGP